MDNKKASIEHIFKKYGKEKVVNWINNYFTSRINNLMTIDKIIYVLGNYDILNEIEDKYKISSEYTLIDMGLIA